MDNWRDVLARVINTELDEATGDRKINGEWLTRGTALTPYGRTHFTNALKVVAQAIKSADEEIRFVERLLVRDGDDPDERAILEKLLARAKRDRQLVVEFKREEERYLALFADAVLDEEYTA